MKVRDLIRHLAILPQDADVFYIFDGVARGRPDVIWLTQDGRAILADLEELVYDPRDRPIGTAEMKHWSTPK